MDCLGNVAHKGERKSAYRLLVRKPEGNNHLETRE